MNGFSYCNTLGSKEKFSKDLFQNLSFLTRSKYLIKQISSFKTLISAWF